ncbi:TlpA family protein disulfide reductase [sulfur-oxidizing endosymbiont of Gigantopelta aegis]|uniref:TlpA family protein disulfide reductase n=1 Tax=sulfur-oxidizing endosymbiont of Gigantopelta aegis TaxID=2794934 RepID=UPI0018DD11CE|nr:TlpA disulfide reductase family protein [sulfur-oxidizing endosymbiont of Gigantopelta aegis]
MTLLFKQTTTLKQILTVIFLSLLIITQSYALDKLPRGIIYQDGRDAPPLLLKMLDGDVYNITESKGKWVFVHFWATWCGPCRKEIPTIQAIVNKFADSHLDITIVNTAESEDTVFNFLGLLAPDINTLMDEDGLATEKWQPRGLPATFFVDPNGKIRYLALGGRPWDKADYLQFLQQLKNKP